MKDAILLSALLGICSVGAVVNGYRSPSGADIHCDLPGLFHIKNRGGSDGLGLCVFASLSHSSEWQNLPTRHFFEWMKKHPGGGWPEKVDKMIKKYCDEKGIDVPDYVQIQSDDLEVLKLACQTGRMPGVTYSFSPTGRYGGAKIAHMVSLVHADDEWFAVLDNNYPGDNKIEWMSPNEFLRTYKGGRTGWCVIFLDSGPPPLPYN